MHQAYQVCALVSMCTPVCSHSEGRGTGSGAGRGAANRKGKKPWGTGATPKKPKLVGRWNCGAQPALWPPARPLSPEPCTPTPSSLAVALCGPACPIALPASASGSSAQKSHEQRKDALKGKVMGHGGAGDRSEGVLARHRHPRATPLPAESRSHSLSIWL